MRSYIKLAWNEQSSDGNNRLKNTSVGFGFVIGLYLIIVGRSLCNMLNGARSGGSAVLMQLDDENANII